jgi:hypothetical protein
MAHDECRASGRIGRFQHGANKNVFDTIKSWNGILLVPRLG